MSGTGAEKRGKSGWRLSARRRMARRNPYRRPMRRVLGSALLVLVDAAMAWLSMLMAVRLRYDSINRPIQAEIDHRSAIVAAAVAFFVWIVMRQDRAIWAYTSLQDFRRLLIGVVTVMALMTLIMFYGFDRGEHFPRSAPFIAGVFFSIGIVTSRLIAIAIRNGDVRALYTSNARANTDAILIGQANTVYNYLRDNTRRRDGKGFHPLGIIETSGQYEGRSIRSVPVIGSPSDLADVYPKLAARRDEPLHLLSLDPNPTREQTQQLIKAAAEMNAPLSRIGKSGGEKLSRFEAADLIGRYPRQLDMEPVKRLFTGKRVLITGAGGSIGSELSRQILQLKPTRLAMVDISELNLFNLERTLDPENAFMPREDWRTYLADVCQSGRMAEIFAAERPEIVLHAAALKHVPFGEANPVETLRTNVLGTQVTLDMCEIHEVEHFVLISTDKAVKPVNIMGASKRVVELLTLARQSKVPSMHASAVRFGNVLASTGSVVTLFEDQIAEGGPVTVTHEDMNRYFMTVQEASSLVLQAAALNATQYNEAAHIYVLEMGEPVNIAQLARNLIRLRGKVPDVDVEIRYIGLRPGEKLSEELTGRNENLSPTPVSGVRRFDACIVDPDSVLRRVDRLLRAIERRDRAQLRKTLAAILQGFSPTDTLIGVPITHSLPDLPTMPELPGLRLRRLGGPDASAKPKTDGKA